MMTPKNIHKIFIPKMVQAYICMKIRVQPPIPTWGYFISHAETDSWVNKYKIKYKPIENVS